MVAFLDPVLFLSGPEEQRKGHSPSGKSSWVVRQWATPLLLTPQNERSMPQEMGACLVMRAK